MSKQLRRPNWLTIALTVGLGAAAIGTTSVVALSKGKPAHVELAGGSSSGLDQTRVAADTTERAAPMAAGSQKGGQPAPAARVKLWELTTGDNGGYFYTASESEKTSAVTKFGFKVTGVDLGFLAPAQAAGTAPLFRLRSTKSSSYLVTMSTDERDRLVGTGGFVAEGVLGYAPTSTCGGAAQTIWRVTNNGVWRLVWTSTMIDIVNSVGWRLDGPTLHSWQGNQ